MFEGSLLAFGSSNGWRRPIIAQQRMQKSPQNRVWWKDSVVESSPEPEPSFTRHDIFAGLEAKQPKPKSVAMKTRGSERHKPFTKLALAFVGLSFAIVQSQAASYEWTFNSGNLPV